MKRWRNLDKIEPPFKAVTKALPGHEFLRGTADSAPLIQ